MKCGHKMKLWAVLYKRRGRTDELALNDGVPVLGATRRDAKMRGGDGVGARLARVFVTVEWERMCANGCAAPVSPPSKAICQSCTEKLEAINRSFYDEKEHD